MTIIEFSLHCPFADSSLFVCFGFKVLFCFCNLMMNYTVQHLHVLTTWFVSGIYGTPFYGDGLRGKVSHLSLE